MKNSSVMELPFYKGTDNTEQHLAVDTQTSLSYLFDIWDGGGGNKTQEASDIGFNGLKMLYWYSLMGWVQTLAGYITFKYRERV